MNINVKIERISNGFIITDNTDTNIKVYHPTLLDFAKARICDEIKDWDKYHIEHDTQGDTDTFTLSFMTEQE